jgi:hypothetical protein
VHLVRGAWLEPGRQHPRVQPFEMHRLDPVEPVLAKARYQVIADRVTVGDVWLVPDRRAMFSSQWAAC